MGKGGWGVGSAGGERVLCEGQQHRVLLILRNACKMQARENIFHGGPRNRSAKQNLEHRSTVTLTLERNKKCYTLQEHGSVGTQRQNQGTRASRTRSISGTRAHLCQQLCGHVSAQSTTKWTLCQRSQRLRCHTVCMFTQSLTTRTRCRRSQQLHGHFWKTLKAFYRF